MTYFTKRFFGFIMLLMWIAGFVIASGFWSTLACFFPPWAWYLTVEKFLIFFAII